MTSPSPFSDTVQIYELRAFYSYTGYGTSSSAWSFAALRAFEFTPTEALGWFHEPVDGSLWDAYTHARPEGWFHSGMLVRDVWPGVQPDLEVSYPPGHPFRGPDSSGEGTPPQTGPLISWRSPVAGRSYRGRTYWGPVRTSECHNARVNEGTEARLALHAFKDVMLTQWGSDRPFGDPVHVIVSRRHDSVVSNPPEFIRPSDGLIDLALRTQRRRENRPPTY